MIQDSKPTSKILKSNKEALQYFNNHIRKIENGLNFKETSYKENFKLSISNIKSDLYEIMMEVMFVKDKLQNIFLKNQVRLNNNTYTVDNNICSDGNNNQHTNSINSTSSNITNTISSCVSNSNSISKHVHQTNQIFLNINNYNHPNENIYNYDYKYKINKSNNFNIINTISNINDHNNQSNLTNKNNINSLNSNRNSHLNTYFSSDLKRTNKNEDIDKSPNEINNQISNNQEDSSAFSPERQQFRNNIFHLNNSKSQFIKINTYNQKLKKIINYSNCNISLEKCNSNSHIGHSNFNQKHESKVGIGGYYDNTNTQSSNVVMTEKKWNNDFDEEDIYKYNKYVNFLKEKEGEKSKKKNRKSISIYEKSSQTSNSSRGLLKLKCINNKILNDYNISKTNKNNSNINNTKTSPSTLNNQISNKSTILLKVKNIEKEEKSMKNNLNLNKSNSKTRPTSKTRSRSKVINSNMNINSYVYKNSNNISPNIGNDKKLKYNIKIYNNENENEKESNKISINPHINTHFNSNNNENYRLSEYINSKSEIKKKRILNVDVLEINLKDPKFNHTQTFRSYNKINENQNGDQIQEDNFKFNPLNENNQNKGSYPYYMFKNSYSKSKKSKNHCNEELFHSNYYPSSSSNSNKSQIYSKLLRRVDVINKSKQTTQHISHLGEIFNMNKVEIFLDDDKKNNYHISNEQVIHNHKNIKIELNE